MHSIEKKYIKPLFLLFARDQYCYCIQRNIDQKFGILDLLSLVQYCFPDPSTTMYIK